MTRSTRTTTRRRSSGLPSRPRLHLFRLPGHLREWTLIPIAVLLLTVVGWLAQANANSSHPEQNKQAAGDFLLFGTVFTQQGFSLPGAEIAVRRAGQRPEKKPRWRAVSDRRGEFAVYVPTGAEYEITVRARGYRDESRKVDVQHGGREDFVFRMQPAPKK